ncbi:MAG: hypothetical protein AABP62_27375 [Planctomycetota bacterium]
MLQPIFRWLYGALHSPPRNPGEQFVDPVFGSCCYGSSTNSWTTRWHLSDNRSLLLRGRSNRPTPEQVGLWREVQERMPHLLREAINSIPEPPFDDYSPAVIHRDSAALSQVRFEADGTVQFFLDLEITHSTGYDLCPMITFSGWQIIRSEWTV